MIRGLSIGRDAVRYHVGLVAEGFEPPGAWVGRGAHELGLSGVVKGPELEAVLSGREPGSGRPLRRWPAHVPGSELLFQVPKSVSILWGTADADVAEQVVQSTRSALDAAIGYLESSALLVGREREPTGMVAASFLHRTSRMADPHLHVHLLVANLGRRRDGTWMAVDRLALSSYLGAAGHLFEAHLRHEMVGRLGVNFGSVASGVAQLEGIDAEVRRAFSQRRGQVERNAGRFGGTSAASRRLAALTDRPERHPGVGPEQLVEEWRARARAVGLDPLAVTGRAGAGKTSGRTGLEGRYELDRPVVARLSELSTFSRRDVLSSACSLSADGLTGSEARAVVERVLSAPEVVENPSPTLRSGDVRRVSSRLAIPVGNDLAGWTTRAELDRRRRMTELAVSRPDAVLLLTGGRGPERDAALSDGRRQWSAEGARVIGLAPDERSARLFESATGIDTSPCRVVVDRLGTLAAPVVRPTVLVATDVERYGSRDLLEIAEVSVRAGCGLVLVADTVSYPDVDRSGLLRAAEAAIGSVRLERGRFPGAEREPVYQVGERLAISDSNEALRERLVRDWYHDRNGQVMVATNRSDVADLNRRARTLLAADGGLAGPPRRLGAVEVQTGDRVVVATVDTAARRLGWQIGQEVAVVERGIRWASGGDVVRDAADIREDESARGVTFRYAYAATPYQVSRQQRRDGAVALVLGEPGVTRTSSGRARYYVVADLSDAAGLAVTADRSERQRWMAVARGAEIERPAHVVSALGPPPADPAARARWRAAAGAVERYRQRWDLTNERDPLGPDVGGSLRKAQRREVLRQVESVRDLGADRTRGPGRSRELRGRELGGRSL